MNIYDFITPAEIDDLPDNDPIVAFTTFERIACHRLADRTSGLDIKDENDWLLLEDARYCFMYVVIAATKKYEIAPIASLSVPRLDKFNADVHRQFRADLDH